MTPDPDKIIVPRKHGELLIEPPLDAQADALREPLRLPDGESQTWRRAGRQALLAAADAWARETGMPPVPLSADQAGDGCFLLTGHQVEFYHPGVWAKVIAVDELARRLKARGKTAVAFDILVDHDLLDHGGFDVPVQADGIWSRQPVDYGPPSPLPVDALRGPSREAFDEWDAAIARHPLAQSDALAFFLSALRPAGEPATHARWLSRARARFEASMGLQVHHVPTSLLCATDAWFRFVSYWVDNAEPLTASYNKHLALYRRRQGIKNPQHPMPDLARTPEGGGGGTFELPFWAYTPGHPRERFTVRKTARAVTLIFRGAELPLGQWPPVLGDSPVSIRPRALTLTIFVRLFLADLFIHGIGGALYDQITDGLLQDLFHVVPPYGCVSAAWLLPLGRAITTDDDVAALKSRRHHVKHNPQLAIDPFTALKTDVAELITARRHAVEEIAASLSTARKDPAARARRRALFDQLHALNAQLHTKAPRLLLNLDRQIQDAERARAQNKVLLWREWFFPLHTTSSLHHFIQRIRGS